MTSLRKSGMLSHMGDLHTLCFPAPLNHALQSGNQFDAARSKFFWAGTAGESGPRFRHSIRIAGESGPRFRHSIPTADEIKKWMKGAAGNKIYQSLVCIAVRQGGEKFFLPGTIIRSDGIVATSASLLSCLNSKELSETVGCKKILPFKLRNFCSKYEDMPDCDKVVVGGGELRTDHKVVSKEFMSCEAVSRCTKVLRRDPKDLWVDVKVLKTDATYKGVLLDADFCSNIAFVKMISVANKIANGESHSRTSGAFIRAAVAPHVDVLGGPIIDPESGVIGVIYSCDNSYRLKATPIVDVLKNLERFEKHREQDPKSVACA